jgi:hypothetical protein
MLPSAALASSGQLPMEGFNMRSGNFLTVAKTLAACGAIVISFACSVNVKKEANGRDKQVDINTLVGGIHVSKQADVADVGLNLYPGARLREKESDGSDKSANVNISGFGFGIKVVALEYESDDAPAKVLSFYKDQLKKYGAVLECHTSGHFNLDMKSHSSKNGSKDDSNELTCKGDHGNNVELKVGRKDDQHIVAVEPQGNGSKFSLVYVRTHGKNADI